MDIELRTRRSLEWDRLKAALASECSCEFSAQLCLQIETHAQRALVELALDETKEALSMHSAGFSLSQDGLPELRETLRAATAGAKLAARELLDIKKMLLLCRRTRGQLKPLSKEDFARLSTFVESLVLQDQIVTSIENVLDDAGNVQDSASPALHQLRKEVVRLNNQSKDELTRIINSPTHSKSLQEPIFTLRNGRYVLPVQAAMRQNIAGIVHDSSASGMTVFVEPLAVVEITNKIRLKEAAIEREIDRLLSALTDDVHAKIADINTTYRALVEIDFIAARARLAVKYRGVRPEIASDGKMNLRAARHPLLVLQLLGQETKVVANDIALGGDVKTLVITGPNTGGKTVYLKTAGLLSMMLRAGLLLPVDNGSTAVIFQKIFADIGDEQSIEQSLSTFSSHMTNIVEIVRQSDSSTLVLLDEIGAGTDPREGEILARVILDYLTASGACTISTTHYGELKTLAYTYDGFINGSLDFDEATLSPTYKMRVGIPGSSKAITIAARLGLDKQLVDKAFALLAAAGGDLQNTIEQLEKKLLQAQEQEQAAKETLEAAAKTQAQAESELEKALQEREKTRSQYAASLQAELQEARQLTKDLIAQLQKAPSIAKAQQAQKELATLSQQLPWLNSTLNQKTGNAAPTSVFKIGQTVKVRSLNQRAVIEALPENVEDWSKAEITVRAGLMRVKVKAGDLEVIAANAPTKKAGSMTSGGAKSPLKVAGSKPKLNQMGKISKSEDQLDVFVRTMNNTLDLRGQRVAEAVAQLERFVDESFLAQVSPIMVIHGHGTGAVRSAVREFLSQCRYGATFRSGETYEGGDGVTVIQFS